MNSKSKAAKKESFADKIGPYKFRIAGLVLILLAIYAILYNLRKYYFQVHAIAEQYSQIPAANQTLNYYDKSKAISDSIQYCNEAKAGWKATYDILNREMDGMRGACSLLADVIAGRLNLAPDFLEVENMKRKGLGQPTIQMDSSLGTTRGERIINWIKANATNAQGQLITYECPTALQIALGQWDSGCIKRDQASCEYGKPRVVNDVSSKFASEQTVECLNVIAKMQESLATVSPICNVNS